MSALALTPDTSWSQRPPVLGCLGGLPTPTARQASGGGLPRQFPRDPGQPPVKEIANQDGGLAISLTAAALSLGYNLLPRSGTTGALR